MAAKYTPDHPPYSSMIERAIRSLKEEGGSMPEAISNYICKKFTGLPLLHDLLFPHYLEKHAMSGSIVCADGRYMMAAQANIASRPSTLNPGLPLPANDPQTLEKGGERPSVEPPAGRRGRPPKMAALEINKEIIVAAPPVLEPIEDEDLRGQGPPKRGCGRPPKGKAALEITEEIIEAATPVLEPIEDEDLGGQDPSKPKRGRGRPPKGKAALEITEEIIVAAPPVLEPIEDEDLGGQGPSKPKRGRGRPPKAKTTPLATNEKAAEKIPSPKPPTWPKQNMDVHVDLTVMHPKPKFSPERRITRQTRQKMNQPIAAAALPSTQQAPPQSGGDHHHAEGEGGHSNPMRGRGRPRKILTKLTVQKDHQELAAAEAVQKDRHDDHKGEEGSSMESKIRRAPQAAARENLRVRITRSKTMIPTKR